MNIAQWLICDHETERRGAALTDVQRHRKPPSKELYKEGTEMEKKPQNPNRNSNSNTSAETPERKRGNTKGRNSDLEWFAHWRYDRQKDSKFLHAARHERWA